MRFATVTILAAALVGGCGDPPVLEDTCTLDLSEFVGTEWVMHEAQPGGANVPNPMARGRFVMEDVEVPGVDGGEATTESALKLYYTTKSPSDVFEYTCKIKEDQGRIICRDDHNLLGWCAALEGHEAGSCTKSRLRSLGARAETDDELLEAMRAAKAAREEAEEGGYGEQFSLVNNNMGNKLQSVVYVEILEASCQPVFTDNYKALYNGRWVEDSNVVGTNPFILGTGDYLWDTCTDVQNMVSTKTAERPTEQPEPEVMDYGAELHYHYAGTTAMEPVEGCTYEIDTYAQWRPQISHQAVTAGEDGKLDWHSSYRWADTAALKLANPGNPTGIYTLNRYQTCGDATERELIDTVCAANFFPPDASAVPPSDDGEEGEGEEGEGEEGEGEEAAPE